MNTGKKIDLLIIAFIGLILWISPCNLKAKKIKNSFTIEKTSKSKKKLPETSLPFVEIWISDTLANEDDNGKTLNNDILVTNLKKCSFAGFDKEPNSNMESFHLSNNSETTIIGYRVRVDYLDMQGRMLHSRVLNESCMVPPGETRRCDIKSWDTQHTYYYYLGNAPKKVATPFKVVFHPLAFRIEENNKNFEKER